MDVGLDEIPLGWLLCLPPSAPLCRTARKKRQVVHACIAAHWCAKWWCNLMPAAVHIVSHAEGHGCGRIHTQGAHSNALVVTVHVPLFL